MFHHDIMIGFLNRTSFNEDIGNWDVSNVTSFNSMFEAVSTFNQDISGDSATHLTRCSKCLIF